jgi:hypothetical protein
MTDVDPATGGAAAPRAPLSRWRTTRLRALVIVLCTLVVVVGSGVVWALMRSGHAHGRAGRSDQVRRCFVEFDNAIRLHWMEFGRLPESLDQLFGPDAPLGEGEVDTDPWGGRYLYERHGDDGYVLRSLGADGEERGTGEDADVVLRVSRRR